MIQTIHLTQPDDWHLHVRDGAALHTVVPHSAAQFGSATQRSLNTAARF